MEAPKDAVRAGPDPWMSPVRCALYARVSPLDQQSENQPAELRACVGTRQWTPVGEFQDEGVPEAPAPRNAESLMAILSTLVELAAYQQWAQADPTRGSS